LEYVQPQWQSFAEDLTGGLDYLAGKIRKPRLEFRALRVDLSEPALRILIYGGPEEGSAPEGKAGKTGLSTWVSGFVRRRGLVAGINASPFDPVTGKEGEPQVIVGVLIREGVLISPPVPRYEALVFYTYGGAAILNQGDLGDLSTIQNAVGGFHRILEENRLSERVLSAAEKPFAPRHPRSAAGLSAEGRYLYLLVIDGRRPGSIGATEAETAVLLRQLGAAGGINLDGGGSSSLALRFPDGRVRPVNIPIHGGIPGRERGVASCLGIGLAPETGKSP
jgi:exopolysaccharide biosynthesis protein